MFVDFFFVSLKTMFDKERVCGGIAERVAAGGRISRDEAETLWNDAPLSLLAELACGMRHCKSGDVVYYNRNFHIEPTNICVFNCRFCSYRRGAVPAATAG